MKPSALTGSCQSQRMNSCHEPAISRKRLAAADCSGRSKVYRPDVLALKVTAKRERGDFSQREIHPEAVPVRHETVGTEQHRNVIDESQTVNAS